MSWISWSSLCKEHIIPSVFGCCIQPEVGVIWLELVHNAYSFSIFSLAPNFSGFISVIHRQLRGASIVFSGPPQHIWKQNELSS